MNALAAAAPWPACCVIAVARLLVWPSCRNSVRNRRPHSGALSATNKTNLLAFLQSL